MRPQPRDRERLLWLTAATMVAAIFASLARAPALARILREQGLLEPLFAAGFVAAVLVVIAAGVQRGDGPRARWVAAGATAVYAMAVLRLGLSVEERTHLFEYGLVALVLRAAWLERRRAGLDGPSPSVAAFVTAFAIGVLDEGVQALVPGRVADPRDVVFNTIAIGAALGGAQAIQAARRRDRQDASGGS